MFLNRRPFWMDVPVAPRGAPPLLSLVPAESAESDLVVDLDLDLLARLFGESELEFLTGDLAWCWVNSSILRFGNHDSSNGIDSLFSFLKYFKIIPKALQNRINP